MRFLPFLVLVLVACSGPPPAPLASESLPAEGSGQVPAQLSPDGGLRGLDPETDAGPVPPATREDAAPAPTPAPVPAQDAGQTDAGSTPAVDAAPPLVDSGQTQDAGIDAAPLPDAGQDSGSADAGDAAPEPCPAPADAYEPNESAQGAFPLEAIVGDVGGRSVGSTLHDAADRDFFAFPILERSRTGPVRISWSVAGATAVAAEAHCPYSAVRRCDGGTILGSTYRWCMLPVAGIAEGEAVVECEERPTFPEPITVVVGAAQGEGCRPEVAIHQEPAS